MKKFRMGMLLLSLSTQLVHAQLKKPLIIDVRPYAGIAADLVNHVVRELRKVYPYVELKEAVALPSFAYFPPRGRYRADSLLKHLKGLTPAGHVSIGLSVKDISTTKGQVYDWGVMGLGTCPGNACVVSTFRLKSKGDLKMRLFKVSIHELGHTQGLPHCPVKTCFMRDAEGGDPIDEEKEFCPKCKAVLVGIGWRF